MFVSDNFGSYIFHLRKDEELKVQYRIFIHCVQMGVVGPLFGDHDVRTTCCFFVCVFITLFSGNPNDKFVYVYSLSTRPLNNAICF